VRPGQVWLCTEHLEDPTAECSCGLVPYLPRAEVEALEAEADRLRAEVERLRAETLRQGQRITELDALLVASEELIERYRELLGKVPPHIMELRDVAGSPSGKETP
jgi:hypothetical protein